MINFGMASPQYGTVDLESPGTKTSITGGIEAPDIASHFLRGNNGIFASVSLANELGGSLVRITTEPRPDLVHGRDDSAHDVRFWNVEIEGVCGSKRMVMADKPFENTERADAEREIAAGDLVLALCGFRTFETKLIINSDEGVQLLSLFDQSVESLDNLVISPNNHGDKSDSVSKLGGSLGIAAATLARLHSVGILHGDVALKNLATSKRGDHRYPFVIDLEDAKYTDPGKDRDRYLLLVQKDIRDLVLDLKRRGWLEFGDGDLFAHFSELFLSHYLSQITHPANIPKANDGRIGDLIRKVVGSVAEDELK